MSRKNANGSSITDLIGVTPVVKFDGGQPSMWKFPEMSAEVFKAGEAVCLSGATATRVGITRPNTDMSGGIVGFAADDAAGSISSFRAVYLATPDTVFCANVGFAAPGTGTRTSASEQTAATDIGRVYGLQSVSGRTFVNKGNTSGTYGMARVVGLHEQDTHPSFYGRVYFTVIQDKFQLASNGYVEMSGISN